MGVTPFLRKKSRTRYVDLVPYVKFGRLREYAVYFSFVTSVVSLPCVKKCAIQVGFRIEHPQDLINEIQAGVKLCNIYHNAY